MHDTRWISPDNSLFSDALGSKILFHHALQLLCPMPSPSTYLSEPASRRNTNAGMSLIVLVGDHDRCPSNIATIHEALSLRG